MRGLLLLVRLYWKVSDSLLNISGLKLVLSNSICFVVISQFFFTNINC